MSKRAHRSFARIILLVSGGLAGIPALAGINEYDLAGDTSTMFPTAGTVLHPGAVTGRATIADPGDGTPILRDLSVEIDFFQLVPCDSGCDGVPLTFHSTLSPAPDQLGVGSTASSISWGALSGWTQSATVSCEQTPECQGGCSCVSFIGFEGTGPAAALAATSFDSDPWTFAGATFEASSIEILNTLGGAITESIVWGGTLIAPVPVLPLAALGTLGAGLVALGVRIIRKR